LTDLRRVRVVAALVRRGEAVLVQQRLPGAARGLLWEFPGGKVEPGETDPQALIRECREELAVELAVEERVARVVHRYADLEVELVLYRSRLVSGEPKALHAQAVRFAPLAELPQLPFCEADVPFVNELAAGKYG